MARSERIITFMGVAGETRGEAFHAWLTRVRRHIAWRLIRPEMGSYLRHYAERAEAVDYDETTKDWAAWHSLYGLERWISGPASWTDEDWWRVDPQAHLRKSWDEVAAEMGLTGDELRDEIDRISHDVHRFTAAED